MSNRLSWSDSRFFCSLNQHYLPMEVSVLSCPKTFTTHSGFDADTLPCAGTVVHVASKTRRLDRGVLELGKSPNHQSTWTSGPAQGEQVRVKSRETTVIGEGQPVSVAAMAYWSWRYVITLAASVRWKNQFFFCCVLSNWRITASDKVTVPSLFLLLATWLKKIHLTAWHSRI